MEFKSSQLLQQLFSIVLGHHVDLVVGLGMMVITFRLADFTIA